MTRRPLPPRWVAYADARKESPQAATRMHIDHYLALQKLARKLDISPALLARIILGLIVDGHIVSAQDLITERTAHDDHS